MKVLQVNKLYYPHIGGIENHVRMLSEGLLDRGITVQVLSSTESHIGTVERYNEVPVIKTSRVTSVQSVPISPTFPYQLRRIASNFDLIHYHLPANPI